MNSVHENYSQASEKLPYTVEFGCTDFNRHQHESVELMLFDNEATLYVGEDVYHVNYGDIAVINPGDVHAVSVNNGAKYRRILVSKNFCRENNCDYSELQFRTVITDYFVFELCALIFEEFSGKQAYYNGFIMGYLLKIMAHLCNNYAINNKSNQSELVKKAIAYMEAHIQEKITVSDIAEYVHMSKYHFSREFRKNMGYTVIDYLNFMRCMKAAAMIQKDGASVTKAANKCGFENPAYFSSVFKNIMGYSPNSIKPVSHRRVELKAPYTCQI